MKMMFIFLCSLCVLAAGCKTIEKTVSPAKPISWREQQAYLKQVRDPRVFGMRVHQTPGGMEVRGGGRLHNWQSELLDMQTTEPFRPVVRLVGNFGVEWPVLLDLTSSRTWFEYRVARKLKAQPVSEGDPLMVRLPGEEGMACLSTTSALRLGQLHIGHPLMYVRLASNSMGPMARDIAVPELKGVIGWDLLGKLDRIQFFYTSGKVLLSTVEELYEPHPELLVATLPMVKRSGGCMVRGTVDGKEMLIAIDPAGDFEVATPQGTAVSSIQIGKELAISAPISVSSPGGVRIGARFLQDYLVTVCPKKNLIFLETGSVVEE